MYENTISIDEITITVSFHENLKKELDKLNLKMEKSKKWSCHIDQKAILKMILAQGEEILSLTNDSQFILVESAMKIGIACCIYITASELEIEVSEIFKNFKHKPDKKKLKIIDCSYIVYRAS